MDPREIALLQSQRGQALLLPDREVQLRGLGMATGPAPTLPPPPPPPAGDAGANSASMLGIPWWAWALLGIGAVAYFRRR